MFYPIFNVTANGGPGGAGATLAQSFVPGFYFAGYAQGLPVSSSFLRFDMYLNFECIVTPQFNNIIPQTTSNVQNVNAIQSASDVINSSPSLVTKTGSEIPGNPTISIGAGSFLKNLGNSQGDTMLPNVNLLKTYLNK